MTQFWQAWINECEARSAELEREVKPPRGPHDQKPGKPAPYVIQDWEGSAQRARPCRSTETAAWILNRHYGQMSLLLTEDRIYSHPPTADTGASPLSNSDSLGTLNDRPNGKSTSNDAKRAQRHGHIRKHLSFGAQRDGGTRHWNGTGARTSSERTQKRLGESWSKTLAPNRVEMDWQSETSDLEASCVSSENRTDEFLALDEA